MLGIGIGGTAEKAAVMAKEVLMESIDIHELKARGPQNRLEEIRLELFEKVNQLGIGAQGLGGLTTVLDVKIMDYPTHAASLPVCMIPNCAATRHAHFVLDGSGPAELEAPSLDATRKSSGKPAQVPAASTSTTSPLKKSPAGNRARPFCSTAKCSPAATPHTSAWSKCSTVAKRCRWT